MDRKFFSNKVKCKGNCKYCFEKWDNYEHFETFDIDDINSDSLIIYPNCDGNFFDEEFEEIIQKLLSCKRKIVVSVTTKNDISDYQLQRILVLDEFLKNANLGFVKMSVSFSCVDLIDKIEEGTLAYFNRIGLIKRITEKGLQYVTIIKPILPFIPFEEYKKLIDDTAQYSLKYITGNLYVNSNTNFYREYIQNKFTIIEKKVAWSKNKQTWNVVENNKLINQIHDYIIAKQGQFFESDIEFVKSILG